MSGELKDPNSADIEAYLREAYQKLLRVDEMLHEAREDLRNRLYALHLETSGEELRRRIREAEAHNEAGEPLPGALTPEEFERRFLAATAD